MGQDQNVEEFDRPFTEYQEGVYMGYRYYETAADHIRQREITAQSVLDDAGNAIIGQPLNSENDYVAATNQFQISSQFAELLGIESSFDVETDPVFGNVEGSLVYAAEAPTSNAKNGLTLADLRGATYDDPRWDTLLDQIDWNSDKDGIQLSFAGAAYITGAVPVADRFVCL